MLLEAGEPEAAEAVYRQDLAKVRQNGWSLYGLTKALEAQGKAAEATKTRSAFNRVWKNSDIPITRSVF